MSTLLLSFFEWIFIILAGIKDNYNNLNEFKVVLILSPTTELAALGCLKNECIML